MTEVAQHYLDAVGACLDLGPESAHEVMAELENHLIERGRPYVLFVLVLLAAPRINTLRSLILTGRSLDSSRLRHRRSPAVL